MANNNRCPACRAAFSIDGFQRDDELCQELKQDPTFEQMVAETRDTHELASLHWSDLYKEVKGLKAELKSFKKEFYELKAEFKKLKEELHIFFILMNGALLYIACKFSGACK